ncbi:hypothetical protein ACH5RR_018400 [Cinchona calisaya]|uniref:Uncharacterized protein n=1 Tax=Cinchona calisaya TaxID=153742 RepID=A0ABD2ZLB6_9GENT
MNSSARFSKIEEEIEQLAVEIRYLQAKDAEFLKQQDSLVAELKKANEGISRKLAELEERSPETRLLMPTDLLEGCEKRRKLGTVGYLLNQSSDEPSITTTGGEAKLRRQLRFLVASFWRLASQVGGLVSKLPSASVKSLSIIGRNGGEVGPPYFNGKGGIAVSQPLLYNYLSPNMITNEDRELRR